jgi:ribosomal-protein-alanine N-acetyltransferase
MAVTLGTVAAMALGRTARLVVRRPKAADAPAFTSAARRSRSLHHPWLAAPSEPVAYANYLRRLRGARYHGFLLTLADGGDLVGVVNISDVVLGSFRSAHLSYYVFRDHQGQGLMAEGLRWVVDHAFDRLGLHRLEANVQPGNAPSLRLAERCGFRREGYSPDYLFIDGAWRDHERWAMTVELRDSWRDRR